MRVSVSNILYNDLVGLRARIISSTDPTHLRVEGTVVDETARTLTLAVPGRGDRVIPKMTSTFAFFAPEEIAVEGKEISFSPEERLKRLQRR